MRPYPNRAFNSLFLLIVFLCSCSQTAVRIPAGMSEADLASVAVYSDKGIDTSYIAIDGIGQGMFDSGLKVVPGPHEAGCDYRLEDKKCYWDNYCVQTIFYGRCRASFHAQKGRSYAVKLRRSASSVFVSVVDSASDEVVGGGSCEETRNAPSATQAEIKIH